MKLYLMRHGQAESYAASDAERQLTEKGIAQSRAMASFLASEPPVRVISSPLVRACQTAFNVVEPLQHDVPFDTCDLLTPDEDPRAVADWIGSLLTDSPVLVVTHNPLVSLLVSWLVNGHLQGSLSLATADVVCLELEQAGPGTATLLWYEQAP
jgi:phosphohistidine phosphatase